MHEFDSREALMGELVPGKCVVEVGVFEGDFANTLLGFSPERLWLVDCWENQKGSYESDPFNTLNLPAMFAGVVQRFQGCNSVSVLRAYSLEASRLFVDGHFDTVYLDADHSEAAVYADILAWWPKVRRGGYLAGHDFLDEQHLHVKPAVERWLRDEGLELWAVTKDCPPSWAVFKE